MLQVSSPIEEPANKEHVPLCVCVCVCVCVYIYIYIYIYVDCGL